MSKKVEETFYISPEKESVCEYCGNVAELRPYGKDGANICYKCGMENYETTLEMMDKCAEGVKKVVLSDANNQFNDYTPEDKGLYLPFETHSIYITIDDKVYKLNKDFSKEEIKDIKEIPMPSRKNPCVLLHKSQFDFAKRYLLSSMSKQTAIIYNKMGFITDEELAGII